MRMFRYCEHDEKLDCGGLVIATDLDDAVQKVKAKYGNKFGNMAIWPWSDDDSCDTSNPQVLEIY